MSAFKPSLSDNDCYLNTVDAAKFIGLSPHTLRSWRSRDKKGPRKLYGPPCIPLSSTTVVYKKADLIAWVEGHRLQIAPAKPGAPPFPWEQRT